MGRTVVKADGVYGPRTRKAIADIQAHFGMVVGGDIQEQLATIMRVLRTTDQPVPPTDAAATAAADAAADAAVAAAVAAETGGEGAGFGSSSSVAAAEPTSHA